MRIIRLIATTCHYVLDIVWRWVFRRMKVRFPVTRIRLDLSTMCQLRCPKCGHSSEVSPIIGLGFAPIENVKRLIKENPSIKTVEISNFGEPFLYPHLEEFLAFTHERSVGVTIHNGANFNTVSDELLEACVKYELQWLRVSIDGASQETYEKYRVGGSYDAVIRNIEKLNLFKEKYRSPYPKLIWKFITFEHCGHEVDVARDKARRLGMQFETMFPWGTEPSAEEYRGNDTFFIALCNEIARIRRMFAMCEQVAYNPQINWNGDLLGCCANSRQVWGNVFEESLEGALRNEEYQAFVRAVRSGVSNPLPCTNCGISGGRRRYQKLWRRLWPFYTE